MALPADAVVLLRTHALLHARVELSNALCSATCLRTKPNSISTPEQVRPEF